jgi:hypothetical protein
MPIYSAAVDGVIWIKNISEKAGRQWLTPVILVTQEAEMRRIAV